MTETAFEWKTHGGFRYLAFAPWLKQGFKHGFIGSQADFSDKMLEETAKEFCNIFQVRHLCLPRQVHGSGLLVVDDQHTAISGRNSAVLLLGQADALLIPSLTSQNYPLAFGIRTADCLPMLLRSNTWLGVIHAGWRSLAAGLVQAIGRFLRSQGVVEIELVIGPAAKQECYEVGREVIKALGPGAITEKRPGFELEDKYQLSLSGTARLLIHNSWAGRVCIYDSGICTICGSGFHSYRRDGPGAGSNLAFVVA